MQKRAVKTLGWALILIQLMQILLIPIAQAPEYDNAILSTIDEYVNQSSTVDVGKHQTFFDIYNQSWAFWAEYGSHWYYSSCNDTTTWATPSYFGQIGVSEIAFAYDESRNIMHVAYGHLTGTGLFYKAGVPEANRTISWNASKTVDPLYYYERPNINYDSNGYVYIGYSNNSKPYMVKNSDNSTGAWVTASGFPYNLNATGTWYLRIALSILANDNVLCVYYQVTSPPATYVLSKLYCANNNTWNAQITASTNICGWANIPFTISTVGNNTYCLYHSFSGIQTRYWFMHNYTTLAWDSETALGGSESGELCYDYVNERIYFLGMAYLDDSALNITYFELSNGTWIDQEDVEEYITLSNYGWSCARTIDQYGRMGLMFLHTIYAPFVLRFAWIQYPITPPAPPEPEPTPPLPDLVSMYIHLGLMLLGLGMMFFAVMWFAWGIRKKGITPNTVERGGYSMLIFIVGFGMLFTQFWG